MSLHRNEAGIVEKNSLIYDITWDGIPEGERSELSAYQVLVNRSDADTVAEVEYADQASFEAALQKLRTLYGSKPGVELEETPDQAVYRWQEEADGNSVLKTTVSYTHLDVYKRQAIIPEEFSAAAAT